MNTEAALSQIFGEYCDKLLQYCNETFSTMYAKIFKKYWHDGRYYAKINRNYATTDWQRAQYEVYIPTRENQDQNLSYFRLTVKVLPEVDAETAHAEAITLQSPLITPMGCVDSELQVIVAPRLRKRVFIRGFQHTKKKGYLTAVIVSKFPEQAFKRILTLTAKFFEKRLDRLLETLGFEPWQYDYQDKKKFYYIYLRNIVERFSHSIAVTIRCFSHVLAWVSGKLKAVLHEIGLQNMFKQAVKPFKEAFLSVNDRKRLVEMVKSFLGELPTPKPARKSVSHKPMGKATRLDRDSMDGLEYLEMLMKAKPAEENVPPRMRYNRVFMQGAVFYV